MTVRDFPIDRLREVFRYVPETGVLLWRVTLSNRNIAGSAAGSLREGGGKGAGYLYVQVDKERFAVHRVAFAIMTGRWPLEQIDHRNSTRSDNRWANLREASPTQNCGNQKLSAQNTTGLKGVSRDRGKWRAQIKVSGKTVNLGRFESPQLAHAAYMARAAAHFGDFARGE